MITLSLALAACGSVSGGPDAPPAADAMIDSAPPIDAAASPPLLVATTSTHENNTDTLPLPITVPVGTNRFLLVTIAIGSGCMGSTPTVTGVNYDSSPLARITAITGTPCGADATRSEQWRLAGPAIGAHEVVISLSAPGLSVHGGALVFTGVDQSDPVRASATGSDEGTEAGVMVASAPGDLVVSSVGQGNAINAPGTGQTRVFLENASSTNTLDNSAASTAPGAAPGVTMQWTFSALDEWQMIVSSLRPAAP